VKFQCCIRFWPGFESGSGRDLAITKGDWLLSSKGYRGFGVGPPEIRLYHFLVVIYQYAAMHGVAEAFPPLPPRSLPRLDSSSDGAKVKAIFSAFHKSILSRVT